MKITTIIKFLIMIILKVLQKKNMQNNQRFGMDYMWYRGDGYGWNGNFFTNPNYYYYNGSPNTPYVDGYNIQNQEVTISRKKRY